MKEKVSALVKFNPTRAVRGLALFSIIAIAASVTFLLQDMRKRELNHSRAETLSIAQAYIRQTDQSFKSIDLILQSVQERLRSEYGRQIPIDGPATHLLLGARVSGSNELSSLRILNVDGQVVNSSREFNASPADMKDRDFYQFFAQHLSTGLFIGKPVRSRFDNAWTLNIARALVWPDGKFRGVIVAGLKVSLFEKLHSYIKLEVDRPLSIYLENGTLIAGVPHRENLEGTRPPEIEGVVMPILGSPIRMESHTNGHGGREDFALGRVGNFPLFISVTNSEEESLASWRETATPIGLGALSICLLIAMAAGMLNRQLMRKEALEHSLDAVNSRYYHTLDSVMDAIIAVDETQTVVLFNSAAETMFGMSAQDALGSSLSQFIPEVLRDVHHAHFKSYQSQSSASRAMGPHLQIMGRHVDGRVFPIESTISRVVIDGAYQYTAVLRDISERKKIDSELREMNEQLRGLSASLLDVREQERTRIARELHDDLGQQLTGIKLDLAWVNNRIKEGIPVRPEDIEPIREMLVAAIASVRRISTELRPLILDDLGFSEAVTWLVGEFSKRSKMEITLQLEAANHIKDTAQATALFRILQESLTNITRHAYATKVDIKIVEKAGRIELSISDNGAGLIKKTSKDRGFGLINMRERTTALNGELRIESSPGQGTSVIVTLPLMESRASGEPDAS